VLFLFDCRLSKTRHSNAYSNPPQGLRNVEARFLRTQRSRRLLFKMMTIWPFSHERSRELLVPISRPVFR